MFIGSTDVTLNKTFLQRMDNYTQREVYAKIISLTWDEYPIAEITGNVVSGSISVDGSSTTRRTCSLNIVADANREITQIEWGLNTKFVVLIGLRNYVDETQPDIIWFQQGLYIITSFSSSYNNQGLNVQIQGKDKMCLLDGSVGGSLFADHDFGSMTVIHDDGTTSKELIDIKDIVREAVHSYAAEPYENILITDLEDVSVELLNYNIADKSLFIYDISTTADFSFYTSQMVFEGQGLAQDFMNVPEIRYEYVDREAPLNMQFQLMKPFQLRTSNAFWYRLVKVVCHGDTAGYRATTLTYPGDLIVNTGSPVTQALDAIVKLLGEFEYYYDIYGRFIFQRKRVYHNVVWTGAVTNDDDATYYDSLNHGKLQYEFNNAFLISSFANKPILNNIRNDFAVWGKLKQESPIHLRYAISDKPVEYISLSDGVRYYTYKTTAKNATDQLVDWRELIYRMALDNSRSQGHIRDLTIAVSRPNADELKRYKFSAPANVIQYNRSYYYNHELGQWSAIKGEEELLTLKKKQKMIFAVPDPQQDMSHFEKLSLLEQIELWQHTHDTGYDYYYADLLAFWRLLYDNRSPAELQEDSSFTPTKLEQRLTNYDKWSRNGWWNPDLIAFTRKTLTEMGTINFLDPGALLFWIDFIGEGTELEKYKTQVIGRRPKSVNDDSVTAIFLRDTPEVLFIDPTDTQPRESDISYVKLNLVGGLINYFNLSRQGKDAKTLLDGLVYDYTYYQESVTLVSLPIYYLEPNSRISIFDEQTGIHGEYIIKSFNLSLSHDGTMNITANRVADRIV